MLGNWTITIGFCAPEAMANNLGTTDYDPRDPSVAILITSDPKDERYPDGGVEQTIIHELLHLVLHGHREYPGENVIEERSINVIADALYWAYRGKKRQ